MPCSSSDNTLRTGMFCWLSAVSCGPKALHSRTSLQPQAGTRGVRHGAVRTCLNDTASQVQCVPDRPQIPCQGGQRPLGAGFAPSLLAPRRTSTTRPAWLKKPSRSSSVALNGRFRTYTDLRSSLTTPGRPGLGAAAPVLCFFLSCHRQLWAPADSAASQDNSLRAGIACLCLISCYPVLSASSSACSTTTIRNPPQGLSSTLSSTFAVPSIVQHSIVQQGLVGINARDCVATAICTVIACWQTGGGVFRPSMRCRT